MEHYAGIDVSLEYSSVCVVDGSGKIVREVKVESEPAPLIGWLGSLGFELGRIGLEAGPLSQWLYTAMKQVGLAVELLETRHVRDAFKARPVKLDRNDARGIAQLMRLGWFRPVHCKSMAAQEVRAILTARKLVQSKLLDVENSLRGILFLPNDEANFRKQTRQVDRQTARRANHRPDTVQLRRVGKGALAPCPPSSPRRSWWARYALPTLRISPRHCEPTGRAKREPGMTTCLAQDSTASPVVGWLR
jgi:transposase